MRDVRLNTKQREYLSALPVLPVEMATMLSVLPGGSRICQLEDNVCEKILDTLTERLGKAGFEEDYEPNDEGRLLEELIDAFVGLNTDKGLIE